MIIPASQRVTTDNGPRPAGKPDECFFCHEKLGGLHKDDCVLVQRLVQMTLTVRMPFVFPAGWGESLQEYSIENMQTQDFIRLLKKLDDIYKAFELDPVEFKLEHAKDMREGHNYINPDLLRDLR